MNDTQIKRFVEKIYPSNRSSCSILYFYDKSIEAVLANAQSNPQSSLINGTPYRHKMAINRHFLDHPFMVRNKYRYLKSILLHEVGHFAICGEPRSAQSILELKAQLWAIDKAVELGMTNVAKESTGILLRWKNYDWRGPYRIYRIAYNKAIKNKKIVKKYGLKK